MNEFQRVPQVRTSFDDGLEPLGSMSVACPGFPAQLPRRLGLDEPAVHRRGATSSGSPSLGWNRSATAQRGIIFSSTMQVSGVEQAVQLAVHPPVQLRPARHAQINAGSTVFAAPLNSRTNVAYMSAEEAAQRAASGQRPFLPQIYTDGTHRED